MPIIWELFSRRWLERAERYDQPVDDVDRFICLWISFNGWLRRGSRENWSDNRLIEFAKSDAGLRQAFTSARESDPEFSENLRKLSQISVINMKDVNEPERCEQREIKYNGSFGSLIDVLYRVRCNLFHGRKDPAEDRKDRELISLAYKILFPLCKTMIDRC